MKNTNRTSPTMAQKAAKALSSSTTSKIQKSLAGSVLSQRNKHNQTGATMESVASKVLTSTKYAPETKSLAASVLSQSNPNR